MISPKCLLLFALAPSALSAWSYVPKPYPSQVVAGWTVSPLGNAEGSCVIRNIFEGRAPTELTLSIDSEGIPTLLLRNDYWTVNPEEKYSIEYRLSSGIYKDHPTIGGDGGYLITMFEQPFIEYFAKSSFLHIFKNGEAVDRLNLKGSSSAVAEARRCVAHIQKEAEAINRDRRRFNDIPENPFSKR